MKLSSIILSPSLITSILSCSQESGYLVENIEDGDTITVNLNGKSQRIQLSGIDAPENTENAKLQLDVTKKNLNKDALLEMGNLATNFLKTQISTGQKVQLQGDLSKTDKYGRIPAIVIDKNGNSVNENMVKQGYAILLGRYPLAAEFKSKLEAAEQQAREELKGLWKSHAEITHLWSGK
jgi:micrococcal nuclease